MKAVFCSWTNNWKRIIQKLGHKITTYGWDRKCKPIINYIIVTKELGLY